MHAAKLCAAVAAVLALGCGSAGRGDEGGADVGESATSGPSSSVTDSQTTGSATDTTAPSGTDGDDESEGGPIFDVGAVPDGGRLPPVDMCKVIDDMDAVGNCDTKAPPDSFDPDVQWTWEGEGGNVFVIVTPLVANLTDDNGDGEIDLCDIPDIVVVAWAAINSSGYVYVLDGETGSMHYKIENPVSLSTCPALGDIDGDGLPEIVTVDNDGRLVAFEHDGTPKWTSTETWTGSYLAAIALADMDNDGDVEIIAGNEVYDHLGKRSWTASVTAPTYSASAAADLDGDGDLELVLGNAAFHHDGSPMWTTALAPGYPQIADLDGDLLPEVLLTNVYGISLLEHDGTIVYQDLRPTGDPASAFTWYRPATIHDFDGDGKAEFAVSSANNYTVYEADASIVWKATVSDQSGIAAGTAFDFLGDGVAEAMYADENFMFVFDGTGAVLLQSPRTSRTGTEYPVVADVDNDGSAEIVVVSNESIYGGAANGPPVQVIRDVEDRWIQARRIWNQHTYHVTNVREDGTIPTFEQPSWKSLNTFRTNAQIEGGGVCMPKPPG